MRNLPPVSYLLHVETAIEGASLCLSWNDTLIDFSAHADPKESAAWIQSGIQNLIQKNNLGIHQLRAISVSNGPGSYTGLRVGLSTAKGLCYALGIPLITISTLKMMADAVRHLPVDLICPMIDARRMEVYTALFDKKLDEVTVAHNLILDKDAFAHLFEKYKIGFVGNGSLKFMSLTNHANAVFHLPSYNAKHLVPLAFQSFQNEDFADLAYAEPCYGKEFYSPAPKNKM